MAATDALGDRPLRLPRDDEAPYLLPESFWTSRPSLTHIREAAHSRTRSADTVLHVVLARIAGAVPFTLKLPAIVGSAAPLCYFVAVVGPPASGKSSGSRIASELLPVDQTTVVDQLPVGSGEGIVEVLFDSVRQPDTGTGRTSTVRLQTKYNAIVYIDEGEALTALGTRSGATTLSTLRSIWSGQALGQTNASAERKRIVPAGQYTYGLVIGLQPSLAGPLLDDVGAGTPQRFGWAWAVDPSIPDDPPSWPGPLNLALPSAEAPETLERVQQGDLTAHVLPVAPEVEREIRVRNLAVQRGEDVVDIHDSHADLLRLKVAALLTILDGRIRVTADDWTLAGVVTTTSVAVRRHVQGILQTEAATKEKAATTKHAQRAVAVEEAVSLNLVDKTARSIVGKVRKAGGSMAVSAARRNCSFKQRPVFEEAVEHAVRHGWMTEDAVPSHTGDDSRILAVIK